MATGLSPGQFLVGGSSDLISICSIATLEPEKTIEDACRRMYGCCMVSETELAFGNNDDPYIRILDLSKKLIVRECPGHFFSVYRMATVSCSSLSTPCCFVSGSYDKTVRLWNAENGRQISMFDCQDFAESVFRLCGRSHRVYFGSGDDMSNKGRLFGWNIEQNKTLAFAPVESAIYGVGLDEENETIYVAPSDDNKVVVFSPETSLDPISSFSLSNAQYIGALLFHKQSRSVLIHDGSGRIYVHDIRRPETAVRIFQVQPPHLSRLSEIVQVGDSEICLSVNMSSEFSKWDIKGRVLGKRAFGVGLYTVVLPFEVGFKEQSPQEMMERIRFASDLRLRLGGCLRDIRVHGLISFLRLFPWLQVV